MPEQSAPVGGGLNCISPNCTLYSGGASISEPEDGVVRFVASRGSPLKLGASDFAQRNETVQRTFRFEILLTPSVPLNTSAHFGAQGRYYQFSSASPTAAQLNASFFLEAGVKVLNVHQG